MSVNPKTGDYDYVWGEEHTLADVVLVLACYPESFLYYGASRQRYSVRTNWFTIPEVYMRVTNSVARELFKAKALRKLTHSRYQLKDPLPEKWELLRIQAQLGGLP